MCYLKNIILNWKRYLLNLLIIENSHTFVSICPNSISQCANYDSWIFKDFMLRPKFYVHKSRPSVSFSFLMGRVSLHAIKAKTSTKTNQTYHQTLRVLKNAQLALPWSEMLINIILTPHLINIWHFQLESNWPLMLQIKRLVHFLGFLKRFSFLHALYASLA